MNEADLRALGYNYIGMKPLEGITVVAVEQAIAAPLATARMADAGARVIKVERDTGDFARGYDSAALGDSSYFAWANHGKESVMVDIKDEADASLLHQMIATADVFVQNLAPGALERSGFGSDALREQYPRLVTCDISGYGEAPELAGKKAYDLLVQAESGLVGVSGAPGELGRIGVSICDTGTAITAYTGVLEALIERSITGTGSGVRVSLFDVAAEWMTVPFVQHVHGDGGPERVGLRHPTIAPYGAFETSEGALTLISIQNEREWHRLCAEVLGDPDLAADLRFASNAERVANRPELDAALACVIATLTRETFQERLESGSIAYGMVSSLDDLVAHPALRHRSVVSSVGAVVELPAHPVRWSDPGHTEPPRVPKVGEHTDAIRKEFSL